MSETRSLTLLKNMMDPIEPPIIEPPDIVESVEANVQPDDDEPSSSAVLEIIVKYLAAGRYAAKNYKHQPKESGVDR